MDDLFWQPSSYEKEGKRSEFLIDSDMTHWSRRGRATDIQDWECQIQDKDKDTNTKTKTLQKKTKSSPFEWPATGLYIVCWSLKIQIQSCRFESRCACVSISGGSNKWLEVDNLLRCVVGNYWLAMNSGHRWWCTKESFCSMNTNTFLVVWLISGAWFVVTVFHKKVLIFCNNSWFLILNNIKLNQSQMEE